MLIQYFLPTLTISVVYYQICGRLTSRLDQKRSQLANKRSSFHRPSISNKENCGSTAEVTTDVTRPEPRGVKDDFSALQKDNHHQHHHLSRMEADIQRMRRTIRLLISIGCIFCFSW